MEWNFLHPCPRPDLCIDHGSWLLHAKWNTHVDNIQSSVSKHLSILRRLKFRLSRTNLDKRYIVYFRPRFEYACCIWDNRGIGNSQKLKQLQQEAARSVIVLPIFTNNEIVYIETVRQKRRKLHFYFITVNKNTSNYLCTLISPPYKLHQCILIVMNAFGFETYRLIGR